MENKNLLKIIFGSVVLIATGFAAGWFVADYNRQKEAEKQAALNKTSILVEKRSGGYKYINPLWECDNFNPSQLNSIVQLRNAVNEYVEEVLEEKKAEHVSVYFRDLNSGPWLGVSEREKFSPASLLKVPILIAALKKAETDETYLQKQIVFKSPVNNNITANIVDTLLVSGQSYSIEELLTRMITYSDNDAKDLVLKDIGDLMLFNVMKDIGINITGLKPGDDFITVKDYSSFFRLLYNATYLNKDMSEKALGILSKSTFKNGLVAGVPDFIVVSHKFGERAFDNSEVRQLHDCGIIYRSGSPYVLCVMTRGTNFQQLASIIAGVSDIVYKNTIVGD